MNLEEQINTKLLVRGFSNKLLINNRGLIGATIDDTIIEVIKSSNKNRYEKRRF